MNSFMKESITFLKQATSIIPIKKGFSSDEKFVINETYLLRVFPSMDLDKRREEFETIDQLSTYSSYIPKAIEFNVLEEIDRAYMVLSYISGEDGEEALAQLTQDEQYEAGFKAGRELRNLHQLGAPAHYPSWYEIKKKKSDRYLQELQAVDVDEKVKEMLASYINNHEFLMQGRPNMFQHDDFHPSNLLICDKQFTGIIDFQRMDWGDPIHDLQKLGFFSKQVSVPFTRGNIDGYHQHEEIDETFWKLYGLYSAMHVVSALVWGLKMSQKQYDLLLSRSMEVIRDHHQFKADIPSWYEE
ncbi:aminoglycoside phosphotransferase family protein [Alkalihalophilus lindianensis]|uniref:Aminoglycoside phosphotransferase family protein n=1 Tax=Alkalihalophilus lindianensis TaxID=1630542 RepID=A0ABU3X4Y6_9BACI|nr:aminoglycoside phosphotransferase family protein [Alkalihalophilus lindianensis]MDV2682944.1 aminoglycoside phosphotransferase family protein [Alkalihalophilus lindianensis]